MKCEVWSTRYEVWSMKYEVWSTKYKVWSVKYEVWSMKYEVWSKKYEVWSVKCEVPPRLSYRGHASPKKKLDLQNLRNAVLRHSGETLLSLQLMIFLLLFLNILPCRWDQLTVYYLVIKFPSAEFFFLQFWLAIIFSRHFGLHNFFFGISNTHNSHSGQTWGTCAVPAKTFA